MEVYEVQKNDTKKACETFMEAFADDPLWNRVFGDDPDKNKSLEGFFTIPVLYGIKYGRVFASTPDLEGVAVWLPGEKSYMGFTGLLKSGALSAGAKIGKSSMKNLSVLSKQLEPDRKRIMKGKKFIYLMIIGVRPENQGMGYGKNLLEKIKKECDDTKSYLYLETETKENVGYYEKHGFYVEQMINVKGLDIPMWEMVRPPQ